MFYKNKSSFKCFVIMRMYIGGNAFTPKDRESCSYDGFYLALVNFYNVIYPGFWAKNIK